MTPAFRHGRYIVFYQFLVTIRVHGTRTSFACLPRHCNHHTWSRISYYYYRPQRSCEGYVFTGVCLSRGSADQVHPPGTRYTPSRTQYTPQDQVHPLGPGAAPWDQVHPLGPGTLPWTRYTPPGTRYTPQDQVYPQDQVHPPPEPGTPLRDQVHLPWAGTPPDQVLPPGPGTPQTRYIPRAGTPPRPGTPPARYTPQTRYTPPRDQVHPPRYGHCCGRYASYWNAFLLLE